jgi:tetratricopeptide (TPR) repeat protein
MTMIALDPRALEGYGHAIELLCQLGEVERAWQLVATAPDPSYYTAVILAMRMAYRGENVVALQNGRDSLIARQAMGGAGFRILRILNHEPSRAVALSDSISGAIGRRSPGREVLLHHYRFAVAQGRVKEAWQFLSQALEAESGSEVPEIQVPGRFMGEEEEAARREQFDRSAKDVPWGTQVFNAWWAAVDGDTLRADTAAALLASYPGWPPQGYRQALGKGLRGLAHLARGDTARARALLVEGYQTRYYQMGLEWSLLMPNVLFSIQLARIDLARGNLEDAARWLTDGLTHLDEELPYRADALELMGQVAERQGNIQVAARAYRSFIALWEHAVPELQPRVVAAREALRRLN